MIIKIIPVKGVQGAKQARLYVQDEKKVIQTGTSPHIADDADNISRVVRYMVNEEKTNNYYISGYMCDGEDPLPDFEATWISAGKTLRSESDCKSETMCYHLIQSFPEGLDISDDEVHQCGLELLQKLDRYQGIVCSHIHPVIDEEGETHGKAKHNHILINAFVYPEKRDPLHPKQLKYHDCKETYAQLRTWNDEIAIDHGLPIIQYPDPDRVYSWTADANKHGGRKMERIRLDIENARRASSNWEEFVAYMEMSGYKIREGANITYTAPDGQFKVRDHKLGTIYKKENLELYWTIRNKIDVDIAKAVEDNTAPPLWALSQEHGPLTASIPLGRKTEIKQVYRYSLAKTDTPLEALATYFDPDDLYDIQDSNGSIVAAATGDEIITYLEGLQLGREKQWMQLYQERKGQETQYEKEEDQRRQKVVEEQKKKFYSKFQNTRTKRPYYVYNYDANGRRRSTLEMLFLIAITVITHEDKIWGAPRGENPYDDDSPAFGTLDWKTQNMLDSIHLAAQEGLTTPEDVNDRLNQVGAEYSRARAALRKTKGAQVKNGDVG